MSFNLNWEIVKALLAKAIKDAVPEIGDTVISYREKVIDAIRATGTIHVTRWRIFGIKIRIRVGVGATIRDYAIAEVNNITAESVVELIRKLSQW